jgi:branched-chain amino acid transport system substrate-binding protein
MSAAGGAPCKRRSNVSVEIGRDTDEYDRRSQPRGDSRSSHSAYSKNWGNSNVARQDDSIQPERRLLSRRSMLSGIAAGTLGVAAWPLVRAAVAAGDVSQIAQFIGPIDPKNAGKGMEYDLGFLAALTGPGASYEPRVGNAIKLAVKHIEMLGGPRFNIVVKDIKSGDPQAGVQAIRELGFADVPAVLSSYSGVLGSIVPGVAQYKIFALDGGGGTGLYWQGKPYFWGVMALTPNDALLGTARYVRAKLPQVKKISSVGWSFGALDEIGIADGKKALEAVGIQGGIFERAQVGQTDYSASIQKLKADKPDMIYLTIYGNDVGYFLKQYATSGIDKPVVAFTHSDGAEETAGPAYEKVYFSFDSFDVARPANPWAKIFIDEFRSSYGTDPDTFAANYYEDTFAMWDVIRRVLSAGGNPKDGAQLDQAFLAKPSCLSLYGGDAKRAGTLECDTKTHSVKRRPITIAQFRDKKFEPLAYFNIGGADFRFA